MGANIPPYLCQWRHWREKRGKREKREPVPPTIRTSSGEKSALSDPSPLHAERPHGTNILTNTCSGSIDRRAAGHPLYDTVSQRLITLQKEIGVGASKLKRIYRHEDQINSCTRKGRRAARKDNTGIAVVQRLPHHQIQRTMGLGIPGNYSLLIILTPLIYST